MLDLFNDDDDAMMLATMMTIMIMTRCYLKSSLTGPMVEFPGTESGPKPCKSNSPSKSAVNLNNKI